MADEAPVPIHPQELDALRQQAAEAIPWKAEAARLAEALIKVDPDNKLLQGSTWPEHFERLEAKRSFSPDEGINRE